jgi:hypothetical protein
MMEDTDFSQGPSAATGKLQEKVKTLLKKQHLRVAQKLVRRANGDEPWSKASSVEALY